MALINYTYLWGNHIFMIGELAAVFLLAGYIALLAVAVPYLANKTQPAPRWNK